MLAKIQNSRFYIVTSSSAETRTNTSKLIVTLKNPLNVPTYKSKSVVLKNVVFLLKI